VNTVFLLIGLLVLSYLGNGLMTRRPGGGSGLPSGVEYAALGFVLGPQLLDLVSGKDLAAFEPVVQVAIGWLAFGVGLDFGFADEHRVRPGSLALGSLGALVTGAGVAAVTWCSLRFVGSGLTGTQRVLLSGGLGAACSQTTRYALRQVVDRPSLRPRPLSARLNEVAHSDSLLPLLAVAALFAVDPPHIVAMSMPLLQWPALTMGLAILLGAGAALLLRSEMAMEDTWGILFGVTFLTIGVAACVGVSTLAASFFLGLAVSSFSRHRHELRAMVGPTERPVLLPALLLAGARLDFRATPALAWIAGAAIVARLAAKIVVGWVLAVAWPAARKGGALGGLSFTSCGALAMCIALAFALRFPGVVGDTVLVVAVLSAVVGEIVGPPRLRRVLIAAGELDDSSVRTPSARRVAA
jgi:Kef-type K+ transport system membrane component KefB